MPKGLTGPVHDYMDSTKVGEVVYTVEDFLARARKGYLEAKAYLELLRVFPNNFGINLCSVGTVRIRKLPDGQLKSIRIDFIPEEENEL